MTKFETIVEALKRDAKVACGLTNYNGSADLAKFVAKYENEAGEHGLLNYAQTRIFEKGVKYVTRSTLISR